MSSAVSAAFLAVVALAFGLVGLAKVVPQHHEVAAFSTDLKPIVVAEFPWQGHHG